MTALPRRITFPGGDGHRLAARLDLPAGPPRAFALFAHCFTCGKDLRVASRISAGMAERGIAVLRFDMTGLGDSEGDFANTDVSSNVADLVAAADWLRSEHHAPQVIVGHSLGGAAALLAASGIPEVRAIATIAAPSDTTHLARLFRDDRDRIHAEGRAEVELAGRRFTIRAEFFDDLERHAVTEAATAFGGALAILHSPIDPVVGIDHAAALYGAARHPKSFIDLHGADHLLSRPEDAEYAADVIATWALRHVRDEPEAVAFAAPAARDGRVVVAESTLGPFHHHVVAGRHHLLADEPESVGGFDAGPSPYEFLAAALGACTSMTLRMYADRKGWAVERVAVEVAHDQVHAHDAATDRTTKLDRFTRTIRVDGDLGPDERERLVEIADRCPVHRTLERASRIDTELT